MKITKILSIIFLGILIAYFLSKSETYSNKNDYKNLIIIAFDGLQAKHLNAYGYDLKTTPNLDKLLDKSYLFTKTISPASWTVPSYGSIFTSMYPSEHKVTNKFVEYDKKINKAVNANLKILSPNVKTLAELLKENGYKTAGFTGDAGISNSFGYGAGFDEYYDKDVFSGFPSTVPMAINWLKNNKDNKFFLFVHGYDSHGQFEPKDGFDKRYVDKNNKSKFTGSKKEQGELRELGLKNNLKLSKEDIEFWRGIYDEKIAKADKEFGILMEEIENQGLLNNSLIVVLSDHGTEFYEHEKFDHGHTLYSELIDVLMAFRIPNQNSGQKINSLVSTLDVMPTVLSILGINNPVQEQTRGIDLSPAFEGKDVSRNIFSETDYRLYTHKRSIQTPEGWKFILTMNGPEKELYNLNSDPGEKNNLADKETMVAYELEQEIYEHLNEMKVNGPWPLGCLPVYGDQCQTVN